MEIIATIIITLLLGSFAWASCVVANEADKWEHQEEDQEEEPEEDQQ